MKLSLQIDEGPLRVVLNSAAMEKYSTLWMFLMKLRRASFTLRDTWLMFKSVSARSARDNRMHTIGLFRQEMDHFVRSLQQYVFTEALNATRERFEICEKKATSIESFIRCHDEFLDEMLFRCLLQKKSATLARIIESLLNLILQFHVQANAIIESTLHQPTTGKEPSQWLDRAAFLAKKTRESFLELWRVLFSILSKLTFERGFQPSLHHLLTVLDFNFFYFPKDETPQSPPRHQ